MDAAVSGNGLINIILYANLKSTVAIFRPAIISWEYVKRKTMSIFLWVMSCVVRKDCRLVLFGAFGGKAFGDNSKALFVYALKREGSDIRSVWLSDEQTVVVRIRSLGGEAYLKKSLKGMWLAIKAAARVTSHGSQDVLPFGANPHKQKELYLHHGIPLRGGELFSAGGGLRDKKHAESLTGNIACMISSSQWAAEQQRKNIPVSPDNIKITGFPRNDILYENPEPELKNICERFGLTGKTGLYAPTWRKWGPVWYFPFSDADISVLADYLTRNNLYIIIRPHPVDMRRQRGDTRWQKLLSYCGHIKVISMQDYSDTQMLMLLSDFLITDYSSILYDFLLLDRPMIFVPYDIDEYMQKMGAFNGDYDSVTPGPKPKTQKDFINCLDDILHHRDGFSGARKKLSRLVCDYQDGKASSRTFRLLEEMISDS